MTPDDRDRDLRRISIVTICSAVGAAALTGGLSVLAAAGFSGRVGAAVPSPTTAPTNPSTNATVPTTTTTPATTPPTTPQTADPWGASPSQGWSAQQPPQTQSGGS